MIILNPRRYIMSIEELFSDYIEQESGFNMCQNDSHSEFHSDIHHDGHQDNGKTDSHGDAHQDS